MSQFEFKPYKDHKDSPAMTFYMIDDVSRKTEKFSCVWCKRTIAEIKGLVRSVVMTPVPVADFGMSYDIRCKLCGQDYRFVTNPTTVVLTFELQQR